MVWRVSGYVRGGVIRGVRGLKATTLIESGLQGDEKDANRATLRSRKTGGIRTTASIHKVCDPHHERHRASIAQAAREGVSLTCRLLERLEPGAACMLVEVFTRVNRGVDVFSHLRQIQG